MKRLCLADTPFSLVFEYESDRWLHRVVAEVAGVAQTIFSSIEGDCMESWPPSPPLQDVELHQLDTDRWAILGVGKAGQSHWSASFSNDLIYDSQRTESNPAILFELAALCSRESQCLSDRRLLSSYRLADDVELTVETQSLGFTFRGQRFSFCPLHGEGWESASLINGRHLTFSANQFSLDPKKATRWGYRLEFGKT